MDRYYISLALEEAKKELGFPGKIIDYTTYLQSQG